MKPDENAPAWQKNAVFRFLASVQLAMLLLTVLTIASIVGTICESSFDAKVARAYIYGAAWFDLWLLLLVVNLVFSAFSRWPWEKRHFSFLITHLGIIALIAGAYIGRVSGIEGTMTLFKGDAPSNLLTVDQRVMRIADGDGQAVTVPFEILNKPPTPEHPRNITTTPSGCHISAIGFSPSLEMDMSPKPLAEGGVPAIHLVIATAMMGQKLESWLLADDPDHGAFDMGLASIRFRRGAAPVSAAPAPVAASGEAADIEEGIFAFAKTPDQISRPNKGGATGAKVKLSENGGSVSVELNGVSQSFDVSANLGKETPLAGTPYAITIKNYWPDFRIRDGRPGTASQEPLNPAVLVFLRGRGIPVPGDAAAHAGPPSMSADAAANNHLVIYIDDSGRLTYDLASRKFGASSGKLEAPLATGWADWKLTVEQLLPHAEAHFSARPAPRSAKGARSEGLGIRAARNGESVEEWAPLGWQISIPVKPAPLQIAYGYKEVALPIGLRLTDFEVERNEGSDTPAGFKSTVEITDGEGARVTGQCWMNNPISYPDSWVNTFSGFTFKISQASWNPENLNQSTVQILRDPGWSLKWMGSLCIVAGVFSLFYLRPGPENPGPPSAAGRKEKTSRVPVAALLLLLFSLHSLRAAEESPIDFKQWGLLAIQDGGRRKPLDTFARETLMRMTGRGSLEIGGHVWKPDEFVLSMILGAHDWTKEPIILVDYKPLVDKLKLDLARKRFSVEELARHPELETIVNEAHTARQNEKELTRMQKEAESVGSRFTLFNSLQTGSLLLIAPPPANPEAKWLLPTEIAERYSGASAEEPIECLRGLASAYLAGDAFHFSLNASRLRAALRGLSPVIYPTDFNLKIEYFYNHLDPFLWAIAFYAAALVALSVAGSAGIPGLVFAGTGMLFHAGGIALRCVIAHRPPVTNMYESVVWVSFGVMVFGFAFWARYRALTYLVAALPASLVCLLLLRQLPVAMPGSIDPLVPVLRSNFWLTIHVLTITLSYAAFLLAMAFGHIVLYRFIRDPRNTPEDSLLHFWLYRVLQLGVLLLASGTILGGVWANYSWGRFWGWDPKETWALIALLCYLVVLHGRIVGWWDQFGLAVSSVVCFNAVLMTWYGVNFVLGKGLHSYGFGIGGESYVAAFVAADFTYVAWACIRSRQALRAV